MKPKRDKKRRRRWHITIFGIGVSIPLLLLFISQAVNTLADVAGLLLGWQAPGWLIGITSLLFIAAFVLSHLGGRGE